ncbi:CatA-like O-acetyltransferase [uncultured Clostridium sp.]|uniref:CatA-like O-acetyltransferase n=1 Tax=uncultured Clostridium sp. TaxID=59620 RepID=UPI00261FD37E|nr:CatA-like O-acetyltransferase [uncultured Clostridium sp.]
MTIAKSTYNLTVNVDISILMEFIKKNDYRVYPTFTWIVSRAINNHIEFRMGYDKENNLGYYDVVHPDYSVLNDKTKIMDTLCTEYNNEFSTFYKAMVNDLDNYKNFGMKTERKRDSFIVSCIPWLTYSSFNVSNESGYQFLFPMVTWGKYFDVEEKTLMPVTLQIHHAVADGYHCSLFYEDLERVLKNPEEYLRS